MTKRRVLWLVIGVVFVLAVAVLIPDTPFYLPDLLVTRGQHGGQPTRYWIKTLNDPDPEQRHQAIFALGAIGTEAGEAVPQLAAIMLEDSDGFARVQASLALSKMDPAALVVAVPALAQALEDKEFLVRMNASLALFRLRREARAAVPALIKAINNQENRARMERFTLTGQEQMVLALGRASAGTAEGLPALTAVLEAAVTDQTRAATVRALGEVGPKAEAAAPLLRPLLQHQNVEVRQAVEDALQKIGANPAEAN